MLPRPSRGPCSSLPHDTALTVESHDYIYRTRQRRTWPDRSPRLFWRLASSWSRLVHCLLLGHLKAVPTLEQLSAMWRALELRADSPSNDPGGSSSGCEPTPAERVPDSPTRALSTRVDKIHAPGIRLWFEEGAEGSIKHNAHAPTGIGGEENADLLSRMKDVYWDTWTGDDGRLDALDLLLTLCWVNQEEVIPGNAEDAPGCGDEGEGSAGSGAKPTGQTRGFPPGSPCLRPILPVAILCDSTARYSYRARWRSTQLLRPLSFALVTLS